MSDTQQVKPLVFYADDDPDDLDFVRESFIQQASRIELVTFPGAIELMEFIHTRNIAEPLPCLIILDINMPRLNGKDALRILRNMRGYENVPAVLFTTSNAPYDAHFAKHYQAGFINKPLNTKQMDLIVDKFLDHCNDGVGKI